MSVEKYEEKLNEIIHSDKFKEYVEEIFSDFVAKKPVILEYEYMSFPEYINEFLDTANLSLEDIKFYSKHWKRLVIDQFKQYYEIYHELYLTERSKYIDAAGGIEGVGPEFGKILLTQKNILEKNLQNAKRNRPKYRKVTIAKYLFDKVFN